MEEEDKHSKDNPCISFNWRFFVAEKLKVIKYTEGNSLHASSNLYRISRQVIRYWIRENEELVKVSNKMSTITLHQGKSSKTITYESEILDYVYYNRALGNALTSNGIIFKLWSIDEKYREKILELTSKMVISLYENTISYFQKKLQLQCYYARN